MTNTEETKKKELGRIRGREEKKKKDEQKKDLASHAHPRLR